MTAPTPGGPVVGVSTAEPPDNGGPGTWDRRVFVRLVKGVLSAGWSLAYSGTPGEDRCTKTLIHLVRAARPEQTGTVTIYLPWPEWLHQTETPSDLPDRITVVASPAPPGAPRALPAPVDRTPDERFLAALARRHMRQEMTAAIDARVVIGGAITGQLGLVPDIVADAVLAIRNGVPLYVIGGLGGAAGLVRAALIRAEPTELTLEHHLAHTPGYAELLDLARSMDPPLVNPVADAVALLSGTGLAGLRNGLDLDDNLRLVTSTNPGDLTDLILRGLHNLPRHRGTP